MKDAILPELSCQRSAFDLEAGISYLNCAYQSPLSKKVVAAGVEGLLKKTTPYKITMDDFFQPIEILKSKFASLINLDDPQRLAYHPSASYGFAIIARNLTIKKKGNIIIPASQFPSNYYAFAELAKTHEIEIKLVAPPHQFIDRTTAWNRAILEAINERTICVTLDHSHWHDGTIFDLKKIREKCQEYQAVFIVDGTQSIGALPFDLEEIKPDALICAGYKFLMGPFSCAISYFSDFFDEGIPIEFNWINRKQSDDFASLSEYQDNYRPKAYRYNVGEFSNFILLPMLSASIDQLLSWKVDRIQDYCHYITNNFLNSVREKGWVDDPGGHARHLFGIYRKDPFDSNNLLAQLQKNKIFVSVRGQAVRISPHVYNDEDDLMRLAELL